MKGVSFVIMLLGGIIFATQLSCTRQTDDLSFPVEPRISLDSISSDTLKQFEDRLVLYIQYQDGDGNLGTSDPDRNSIFVQDSRLQNPDAYYLPPLAPENATISIEGNFELELSPIFLLGNSDQETCIFSITVVDRAGNTSNEIQTPEVVIRR